MEGSGPTGRQTIPLGQNQAQQPAIQAPTQAVGFITAALLSIQPPAKPGLLKNPRHRTGLVSIEILLTLQRWIGQQSLKSAGGQAPPRQLQQLQHGHGQSRAALLAAIGEPPGKIEPDGITIVEDRAEPGGIAVDLGCHHQNIPWFKRRISRQPLQDAIADQLHLAPWPWSRLEQRESSAGCRVNGSA